MAPTHPDVRSKSARSGAGLFSRAHREGAVVSDSFLNTKKDKRIIKHSAFVSRIEKAHSKPLKRRRPNKKLVTNLESLGNVLGELESGLELNKSAGKFTQKSMQIRPGALKRKEKLERMEKERFGKNMAQLVAGAQAQNAATLDNTVGAAQELQPTPISGRWAALRGFISQTMEQKEEFKTK